VIENLTQAFFALGLQASALSTLQRLVDIAQKSAAIIAIVGTAGWAYFKFVRGRTFRRRLELTISGEVTLSPGIVYLLTNSTAKNLGLSKFEIDHEKSGLRVMTRV
jgi:hypothetical protein